MSCCKHFSADFFHKRGKENCLFAWYFCGSYTTTRENGELRQYSKSGEVEHRYTTTRENGELRQLRYTQHISPCYTTTRENAELRLNRKPVWHSAGYTTTRENGELRPMGASPRPRLCYTTTRENGEQRQCLCQKYSVMISPHIISAFTVFVNPQTERNVFNKNSPWKWMLPSLEFPWQDFIRMTAEMQFAF